MARHILIPVDESDQSTKALEYALQEYPDEQLTVLHVAEETSGGKTTGKYGVSEQMMSEGLKEQEDGNDNVEVLEQARQTAADHGVTIELGLETGDPAETIVEYVDTNDIDHVVIGSHGRSGASRILYGSVAEGVTRNSVVPVTVIR